MSASSATAQYVVAAADAAWRDRAQIALLPISTKAPPSRCNANDAATKSSDRLLSTASRRVAPSSAAPPIAHTVPSLKLHKPDTPAPRSCTCLCGRPAVPTSPAASQCKYSAACIPKSPATACRTVVLPACCLARSSTACTVLQIVGTVHACSNDSVNGLGVRKGGAELARERAANEQHRKPLFAPHEVRRWRLRSLCPQHRPLAEQGRPSTHRAH
eukprot:4929254-Prymnesium_polylepis.2